MIGGDKLDMWKFMIRDDANRFKIENEEKQVEKKIHQASYKLYLEKQMENQRQTNQLETRRESEEMMNMRTRVVKMTELENRKREMVQVRIRNVSVENN